MNRRTTVCSLVLVAAGLSGCANGDPKWLEHSADEALGIVRGTVVYDATGVQVVEGEQPDGLSCAQVIVDGAAWPCVHMGFTGGVGGYSASALRTGSRRHIDVRSGALIREFVVWSSSSPSGRTVDPIWAADSSVLLWEMEPGEEPWGVQIVNEDGTLGSALPFVGLPGK